MKRVYCLCLCLGILPFAAGCVEDAKAHNADKPGEKVKADSPPSDSPKSAKTHPLEFAELPTNDPLVAHAIQAREQIAELEEELLEKLDELRSVLASAKSDPDRMRQSTLQFVELTKAMRQKTLQANDALDAVSEKTSELSRSSRHLASSYRALAELFRKKARDYSEKKLRDQLLGFARDYDEVAKSIPERTKTLDAVQKKLPSLNRKVREVNAFLTDTIAFLNTHPGIGAEPRDRYSAELESFAVTFTEWIRVLDELRSALREKAVSKMIQESYRKEVVALQTLEAAKQQEQARIERERQDAIAKAEQVKREEQVRVAKRAEVEPQTRERVASVVPPAPVVAHTIGCQPVAYWVTPCPPPVTYQVPRPCQFRLFPLFRRGCY